MYQFEQEKARYMIIDTFKTWYIKLNRRMWDTSKSIHSTCDVSVRIGEREIRQNYDFSTWCINLNMRTWDTSELIHLKCDVSIWIGEREIKQIDTFKTWCFNSDKRTWQSGARKGSRGRQNSAVIGVNWRKARKSKENIFIYISVFSNI